MEKPKYKVSITTVIVIFLVLYLGELVLSYGIFQHFLLPGIMRSQQAKTAQKLDTRFLDDQQNVYALIKANNLTQASTSAQALLTQSKNSDEKAISLQVIGEVYEAQQNYTQAKAYFNQAITVGSTVKLPGAYLGLANINIEEKDFQSAITNAQKAIDLDPTRTDFYDTLGVAYFGAGDKEKAIESLQKAVDGNPNTEQYKKDLQFVQNAASASSAPQSKISTQTQTASLGYTIQNAQQLVSDMDQGDKNLQIMKEDYIGHSVYNQTVVNQYVSLITQRKAIAQQLLNKMSKGEPLDQNDLSAWNQYETMGETQSSLIKTLENSNGGY